MDAEAGTAAMTNQEKKVRNKINYVIYKRTQAPGNRHEKANEAGTSFFGELRRARHLESEIGLSTAFALVHKPRPSPLSVVDLKLVDVLAENVDRRSSAFLTSASTSRCPALATFAFWGRMELVKSLDVFGALRMPCPKILS